MKPVALPLGLAGLLLSALVSMANAHSGVMVSGDNFEGVIVSPEMTREFSGTQGIFGKGTWTVSPDIVRRAERALPGALVEVTPAPRFLRTYYIPAFFSPKGSTPAPTPGHERLETSEADSVTADNEFLYDVRPVLSTYKRQYLGVTEEGKRYLMISFIADSVVSNEGWRSELVVALGGSWLFWDVLYDPVTGTFSKWECNADE